MDVVNAFDYAGVPVVAVSGDLDVFSSTDLDRRLGCLVEAGHLRIVVDLDDCDFVDCRGLGVLVGHLNRVRSRGGELALICTRRRVLRVLELTGVNRVFPIASTRSEGLSALTPDSTPAGPRPVTP